MEASLLMPEVVVAVVVAVGVAVRVGVAVNTGVAVTVGVVVAATLCPFNAPTSVLHSWRCGARPEGRARIETPCLAQNHEEAHRGQSESFARSQAPCPTAS